MNPKGSADRADDPRGESTPHSDSMREDLRALWDSIESRKWHIVESVARLPESIQRQSPKGSWSPVQIVQHLVKAEEVMLREIEAAKTLEGAPTRNVKHRMLVWVMRRGIRIPASPTMAPEGDADLNELSRRWDLIRARLLEKLNDSRDDRPFARNSFLGPISADQALELTDAHLQYHQRQLGTT